MDTTIRNRTKGRLAEVNEEGRHVVRTHVVSQPGEAIGDVRRGQLVQGPQHRADIGTVHG